MQKTEKTAERRRVLAASLDAAYSFPDFDQIKLDNPDYNTVLSDALNFANYTYDVDQYKKFVVAYSGEYSYKNVPAWEFIHPGKLCWILNNAGELAPEKILELNKRLSELEAQYTLNEPSTPAYIPTTKQRKTSRVLEELEDFIDRVIYEDFEYEDDFYILPMLDANVDMDRLITYCRAQYDEINDPELKDSFKVWNKKQKELISNLFAFLLVQFTDFEPVKKVRKARKVKPRKINPTKVVSKLKYLKDFKELGLVSVSPEKVIGANILWVYNTKTRKLGQYIASSDSGLMIKGSTILNFNADTSQCKKLRKPKEVITKLQAAGKVEQRAIMNSINSVGSPLTGRINGDTILVKVY